MKNTNNSPLVSIIIPSYKSYNTLKYVLASIKRQTYKNIEVIVVDRPSNDNTDKLVKRYGYIYLPLNSERTKAVNFGARKSSGYFIYYLGADYILESKLIETVVNKMLKKKADAAIIPNSILPKGFWSRVRWLEKECYKGDNLIEAARFFTRKAFFGVGGYDESMVAYEEHDLHNRLLERGYKIIRVDEVTEWNIGEPDSLSVYIRKYFYYGYTIGRYLKKYTKKSIVQLSPIRLSFIRNWKILKKYPLLTMGLMIFQISRYLSAIIGYIVSRL